MATNTRTEVPGQKGAFPPFQGETFASQLVWLTLTFVLLYVLMAKVALPRIGSIMDERRTRMAQDVAEAERLKGESDAALAAYEKALADARTRAQSLANETREKHAAEAEQTRKALEAELASKLAEAETAIAATKSAAMANVRAIATEAAAAIVQKLLGTAPRQDKVAGAVADVLKR
jgi:F-type H+-transporting ATPase subunit b